MLTLERWGRRSIYSLEGRRGTRASALYCAQTEGAGCPGDGPDVRAFPRGRMSGLGGRMSGLEGSATVVSVAWRRMSGRGAGFPGLREGPDVRGWGRMSGMTGASLLIFGRSFSGCPGVGVGYPAARDGRMSRLGARMSGPVCLRTLKGRSPCTPSPPRLYILLLLHLSRVSIGLAHS